MIGLLRTLVFAVAALASASCAAQAEQPDSPCAGFSADAFVAKIPYYGRSMARTSAKRNSASYVHQDDSRISMTLYLVPSPVETPVTRGEFLKGVSVRLQAEAAAANTRGVEELFGVFPSDPVSWSTVTRTSSPSGGAVSNGVLTIRVSPSCHLVADWTAPDASILQSRVQEFGASLEAIRVLSLSLTTPPDFVTDDYAPVGPRAIAINFVVPLLFSFALSHILRSMILLAPPSARPRAVAAAAALVAAAVVYFQAKSYVSNFGEQKYLDNALLMTTELLLLSYAAATGRQLAMLAGLASSAVFGVVLGTTAWVGWAPNTLVAAGSAVVFTSAGAAGLAIWQHEAGRQVDNAPDDGHGKLGFAKGGRTGART